MAGIVSSLFVAVALPAAAQEGEKKEGKKEEKGGGHEGRLPIAFAERPLTYPQLVLGPSLEQEFLKIDGVSDMEIATNIGVRFGILDDLEVGALAVPLIESPEFRYGDPRVDATYRFVKGEVEVGGRVLARIPTRSGENFGLQAGIPARIHLGKEAAIDAGAYFLMNGGATLPFEGFTTNVYGVYVPLSFAYDILEELHVGARTGFALYDFNNASKTIGIPLGLFAGYVIKGDKGPLLDIDPFFTWPVFVTPGGESKKVQAGTFQTGLEATFFLYL